MLWYPYLPPYTCVYLHVRTCKRRYESHQTGITEKLSEVVELAHGAHRFSSTDGPNFFVFLSFSFVPSLVIFFSCSTVSSLKKGYSSLQLFSKLCRKFPWVIELVNIVGK